MKNLILAVMFLEYFLRVVLNLCRIYWDKCPAEVAATYSLRAAINGIVAAGILAIAMGWFQ